MRSGQWQGCLMVLSALSILGCGQEHSRTGGVNAPARATAEAADSAKGHDHSGWWCDEHGVPEALCGQCSAKVAAECKKFGDWCSEHDRPDSQCFVHHPEFRDKFAAQYRAKYGNEPPPIEEEGAKDQSIKKTKS